MGTDCVLPVATAGDLDRARMLVRSLAKFCRFESRLLIAGSHTFQEEARRLAPGAEFVAAEELIPTTRGARLHFPDRLRQALGLAVAGRVSGEYYWLLDAGCFAVRPIFDEDFLAGGRGVVNLRPAGASSKAAADLLGVSTPRQVLEGPPVLLHRGIAEQVWQSVGATFGCLLPHAAEGMSGVTVTSLYHAWSAQAEIFGSRHVVTCRPLCGNELRSPAGFPRWNPAAAFRDREILFSRADPKAGAPAEWLERQLGPYLASAKRDWLSTLAEFRRRGGRRVVEVGSLRLAGDFEGNGCGTLVWAQNAEEVWTVDIDPSTTQLAAEESSHYGTVQAVTAEGVAFLTSFGRSIDLLYLDGWDCATSDGVYLPESAERHLEAYQAAKPWLHARSLVLIDDTFADGRGKGERLIPAMLDEGWRVLTAGYQTLLGRDD